MVPSIKWKYWEIPIDSSLFGLEVHRRSELRIPFAYYVRQHSTGPHLLFHHFSRLPTELQLRIIELCDKLTLFRLMHTSHLLRTEAKKFFFADPETWYCVDGYWLEIGGHPTDGLHDPDFLNYIQYAHIHHPEMIQTELWTDELIRAFWKRVQRLLPQAKHVKISEPKGREGYRTSRSGRQTGWSRELYYKISRLCPPDINLFFPAVRGPIRDQVRPWERFTAWEDGHKSPELVELHNHSEPSVIVPNKPYQGRVGQFQHGQTLTQGFSFKQEAVRRLFQAVIDRLHFSDRNEPFQCPAPNCDIWFEKPGEFWRHVRVWTAREPRHDEYYVLSDPYLQPVFEDCFKKLELLRQQARAHSELFREWWGEIGSEERRVAEETFNRELEEEASLYDESETPLQKRWLKAT